MEKMKSGDIYEVADVVRNLSFKQKEKGLSTGEKKMLNNAKQILVYVFRNIKNSKILRCKLIYAKIFNVTMKTIKENIMNKKIKIEYKNYNTLC